MSAANAYRLHYQLGSKDHTLRAFQKSRAKIRGIMGPVGSGKTSCCLMEFPRHGIMQEPSPIDGHRYTRGLVIRDTYRNLERTTIPSWLEWLPKETGEFRGGSSGEPGRHHIVQPLADGSVLDLEVLFIAIQDWDIEDVFRGFPTTFIYVNEADRLSMDVIHVGRSRLGRYPAMRHAGPTWSGMWCDFNAPNWGEPIDEFFISDRPDGVAFFEQPSGLSPEAENMQNLPDGYYEEQMNGQPEHWVGRFVRNELGHSREGKPVYPEMSMRIHVSRVSLQPLRQKKILVSADAGRSPAFTFMQKDFRGQIRILREIVLEDVGAKPAGERLADAAAEFYPRFEIVGVCDPAAANPTETSADDDDVWMEIVSRSSGIRFRPARTNKAEVRRQGMRQCLTTMLSADTPAILISHECTVLARALAHGFRYPRRKLTADLYHETPEKNGYSHVAEAAEYGVLELTGFAEIMQRIARRSKREREPVTKWRPSGF